MWASILLLLPSSVYLFISRHCGMKRPGPTLRVLLHETGSTPDIWLVPYMWLAGVCISYNSWYRIYNGGPRKGCNRDNCLIAIVAVFVGKKRFLCESSSSHVKLAKDKVEASNFILQGQCDMVKIGFIKLFIKLLARRRPSARRRPYHVALHFI